MNTNPEENCPVAVGDLLAGKYRVERILGVGGMGVVVAATHEVLQERVAIKFLLPEVAENKESASRFLREARAAVRIKSEHVARVTDVGTMDSGAPYMVMEYLDGRDLADELHTQGPLSVPDVVNYVSQACVALAEAHAAGIVHRDIKPSNLFLTKGPDGTPVVKVLDFGISKTFTADQTNSTTAGLTRTHTSMGSPVYMSPEQMRSARGVDARTDIWSLGVLIHELLTGYVPFLADSMPQLCAIVLEEEPPKLRDTLPDCPEGLEAAVLRCLEKRPADRFTNVAELINTIAPYGPPEAGRAAMKVARVIEAAGLGSTMQLDGQSLEEQAAESIRFRQRESRGQISSTATSFAESKSRMTGPQSQKGKTSSAVWVAVGGLGAAVLCAVALFALGNKHADEGKNAATGAPPAPPPPAKPAPKPKAEPKKKPAEAKPAVSVAPPASASAEPEKKEPKKPAHRSRPRRPWRPRPAPKPKTPAPVVDVTDGRK